MIFAAITYKQLELNEQMDERLMLLIKREGNINGIVFG